MSIIISNFSVLIGLSKIEKLDLLKELWKEIIIPEAVFKEVVIDGSGKPGVEIIAKACEDWIKIFPVKNKEVVKVLRAILDEGEAEVIALGQELSADLLLLDNREPRIFAKSININVIGTVGIIRLAWERKLIKDPIEELYKLRTNGFWIDEKIIERFKVDI
ncbi:MAG TPA: DUF3368 domain-containing protein [Dictyoglomaceae bacterium]|nr:DUF3368 domain-containing protein [Dictyoglomaceae bacterium]